MAKEPMSIMAGTIVTTDDDTEGQSGEVACARPQSQSVRGARERALYNCAANALHLSRGLVKRSYCKPNF